MLVAGMGRGAARLFVAVSLNKLTLLLTRYDFSLGTYRTFALISKDVLFQAETARMAAYRIVKRGGTAAGHDRLG